MDTATWNILQCSLLFNSIPATLFVLQPSTSHFASRWKFYNVLACGGGSEEHLVHHRVLYVLLHSEHTRTSPQMGICIVQDAVERGWFTEDCSTCRGVVDFQRALALAQQIAEGMAFLHANNIVHGVRGGQRSSVFGRACSEGRTLLCMVCLAVWDSLVAEVIQPVSDANVSDAP